MAKRTNYAMVYITKDAYNGGFKLWNSEPQKTGKKDWVDSHGNHPLAGDTMPLVEAQVYDGCDIQIEDDKATPAIIVPMRLLPEYGEVGDLSNDMLSFHVDSNIIELTTDLATNIGKSSTALFNAVKKIEASAKSTPRLIVKADTALGKHEEIAEQLKDKVKEIEAIVKTAKSKAKKHKDITDAKELDEDTVESYVEYTVKHLEELLTCIQDGLTAFSNESKEVTDKMGEIVKSWEPHCNNIDKQAEKVEGFCRDLRTKIQMRPAGEAVRRLYSRIEILNQALNAQISRNLSLKTECMQLENTNIVLANEAMNLREDMATWLKKEMPQAYKDLMAFNRYTIDTKKATSDNSEASKRIISSILKAQDTCMQLSNHFKIEEGELRKVAVQQKIVTDRLADIIATVRQRERLIKVEANEEVSDTVQKVLDNRAKVVAEDNAAASRQKANEKADKEKADKAEKAKELTGVHAEAVSSMMRAQRKRANDARERKAEAGRVDAELQAEAEKVLGKDKVKKIVEKKSKKKDDDTLGALEIAGVIKRKHKASEAKERTKAILDKLTSEDNKANHGDNSTSENVGNDADNDNTNDNE